MAGNYDVILVGAGHNGLVAACYLAKAGRKVLVLERRHLVGGAAVTEEVWPGYKVSTLSYVNSLFRKEIIRDLRLTSYGFEMLERNPSSFTPFPDGRSLMMGPDGEMTRREIAKFSVKDAESYPKYEAMLERVSGFIEPLLAKIPPDVKRPGLGDLWSLLQTARSFQKLDDQMVETLDMLVGAARPILDRWFESEQLKVTIATDAVIGAFAGPSTPGTGYVLFHHVMGETNGKKGVWGYVKGGMGGLTQALAAAARDLGVEIRTEAEVKQIIVRDGAVTGVALANGDELRAPVVASNADPNVTFFKLMDPKVLPADFAAAMGSIRYDSATLKINVALSEVPNFKALPGSGPGLQHRGTMHISPDQDYIERGYDDAKYGRPSKDPILECTMASVVDPTVAPPGKHLMSMFIQYAPYKLREGNWDQLKEGFADRCFDVMNEYAPNFKNAVIARQIITPLDMERTYSLTGGNICQGVMSLDRLFMFRPAAGFTGYGTPIRGLYLCGAATHPGGGVMGACGWNAARQILKG